jgi:D-alanyl-lipoteichoic acid acyltransferase DltB (MBOAT superfamily)
MLFNSYAFLFVFLPVTLLGYQLAGRFHRKAVVAWLGFMSCAFYAYWHPAFLIVLVSSIAFNYLASLLIAGRIPNKVPTVAWLWVAIAGNLGALGYFKYFFPLLNFLGSFSPAHPHWLNVALPLGISFFTFTQIAFLVDLQQGVAKQQDIVSYVLFVTFFPHLIAGPILHHKEMMPQFQQDRRYQLRLDDLAVGFSWFILGLSKKVLLADSFSRTSDLVFAVHGPVAASLAWRGVLCYMLQIYFDFSGYSDMALGLARMFSIDFPLNFNSPYKASSMIDFWQRWHITLSQYINAYLFTPIQLQIRSRRRAANKPVNRAALSTPQGFFAMIATPTLISMFIAGIWHGAGLQFLIYGLLHGFYITVNHAWNMYQQKLENEGRIKPRGPVYARLRHGASVLLTFTCVLTTWVFFHADSTRDACTLLRSMAFGYRHQPLATIPTDPAGAKLLFALVAGYLVIWLMPNTQQILSHFKPSLHPELVQPDRLVSLFWKPNLVWALGLSYLFFFALVRLQVPSTFLYFQF